MHLWDLSAYLPAGHLVIRMDSMGPVPTWRDAAYALDRAGHRSASFGACQGRFEALCTGDVPEPDGPWALRGAGFDCWAWPVGSIAGAAADCGAHADVCPCPNCKARLTGPAADCSAGVDGCLCLRGAHAAQVPASVRSTVEALPPALGSFLLALANNLRVSLELLDGQGPVDQVPVEQVPGADPDGVVRGIQGALVAVEQGDTNVAAISLVDGSAIGPGTPDCRMRTSCAECLAWWTCYPDG